MVRTHVPRKGQNGTLERFKYMKRTKLSKTGKTPISKLKRELWKYFSLYIRQRDRFTCFTCGRKGEGKGMHAGHFIAKSVGGIALYFNEENVHCQCYNCNINLGGNQYIYGKKLGSKADELYKIKNTVTEKWTESTYREKIEHYKKLSTPL